MTRLYWRLPEFPPRTIWSSAHAREVWQPRFQRISARWLEVERESVVDIRPSALQHCSPEQLPELMKAEARRGLTVLPLAQVAKTQSYQSASVSLQPGAPFDYKVAVTRPEHAARWADAWSRSDDAAIGELLGTPPCCRAAFARFWSQERWMDLTWPSAQGQAEIREPLPTANLLHRWHGVRPVSHLVCSFHCRPSAEMGERMLTLMGGEEAAWMAEILSWPVLWSALHGIAEIVSPISRTSVPTDATAERLEVRYEGAGYPAEGARGLSFPHRRVVAAATPLRLVRSQRPDLNGFSSPEAMKAAHAALSAILVDRGVAPAVAIDLGCGDGTLLRSIKATRRVGIESDPIRAKAAEARLDRVVVGDCTDVDLLARVLREESPDLIIAQRVRNPPNSLADWNVLSYSYESGAAAPILIPAETHHAQTL